jgi:hypothetical protein
LGGVALAPDGVEPVGRAEFRALARNLATRCCSLASRWSRIWDSSCSIFAQRLELGDIAGNLTNPADRGSRRQQRAGEIQPLNIGHASQFPVAISPDGNRIVVVQTASGRANRVSIHALSGGTATPLDALESGWTPGQWSDDGRALFVTAGGSDIRRF